MGVTHAIYTDLILRLGDAKQSCVSLPGAQAMRDCDDQIPACPADVALLPYPGGQYPASALAECQGEQHEP